MLFPVLIYMIFCKPGTLEGSGLAIPMATDIAFSLGVLSLLGKRVPLSLKIFLTAFAVVDDIGGILVIAIFYSSHLEIVYLLIAALIFLLLWITGRMRIHSKMLYFLQVLPSGIFFCNPEYTVRSQVYYWPSLFRPGLNFLWDAM